METICGCAAILYIKDNPFDIVLTKRSSIKKKYNGYWELPGGSIEDNENSDECIKREIKEELNLEIFNLRLNHVDLSYHDNKRYIVFIYSGCVDLKNLKLQEAEIDDIILKNIEEIDVNPIYPRVLKQISQYRENL